MDWVIRTRLGLVCMAIALAFANPMFNHTLGVVLLAISLAMILVVAVSIPLRFILNVKDGYDEGMIGLHRSARQCFRCGYALSKLPQDESRSVVCPECGAAWRIDDSGRPVPNDDDARP